MTAKLDGTRGLLQQYDYQAPTTGFSYTFAAGTNVLIMQPAGTLATGTVTMPASPADGMTITFSSTQAITALTVNGNTGQSIVSAPTTLPARQAGAYVYRLSNTTWYPIATVPATVPAASMVQLNTANGYGSTNTVIRRYTNTVTNQGTDITYADSATLGASFTINTSGVYAVSSYESFTPANGVGGISLNSNQLTTSIAFITIANRLAMFVQAAANVGATTSWTGYIAAGGVVRPHNDGSAVGSSTSLFTITKVN